MEKAREAADLANIRSAYAAVVMDYLEDGSATPVNVKAQQTIESWQTDSAGENYVLKGLNENGQVDISVGKAKKGSSWKISWNSTTNAISVDVVS